MLGNKMGWVLSFSVALGSALILAPGAGAATHYPPGSACYDCHAVSKAKMIVGTRLIKKSQKTIDLGMGTGDTAIRCLFCHETGAVSVGARTTMLGVWEHFQPTSRSKHPVVEDSTFSEGTTNRFDCMDCHTGISAGVVSDGAGNATVHGSDASTAPHVDPYPTLVGAPANAGQLSANTCQNAVCHDADGGGVGNYDAPPLHAFVTTTINDGAAPTECTDCHGTHNSYQGDALVVLRSDGTTSNDPAEPLSTLVTPEKCGECHSADDGAAASDFVARGHGRSDLTGGALTCTNCHDATIPHGFSRDAVTQGTDLSNPMRFASASYDETTELKSGLSGKASEGMCMLCHNTYAGLIHNGGGMNVSCQDCHEAHGKGMGANTRMVREQIPLLGGATDTMIFTGVVADDYWDQDFTNGQHPVNNSSYGVCDNMDCHGSLPESPIATFVAAAGSHTGGEVTVGSACGGCHSHDSANGTWAAGATACSNCHGYPPATNAHQTHVSDAGFGCENCHPGPGVTNHFFFFVRESTDFYTQWNVVRDNLDVGFAQSPAYTTGTYSLAKGVSRPDDAVTYGTCTTDCHGGALDAANQGTRLIPQWSRTDTLLGAGNGDGACGTCHDVARDGDPANTPDSGNHLYHTATSASNLGFGCQSCHSTTTQNGTSIVTGGGTHVDGAQSLAGGGVFSTVNVSFGFADPTCSAITCHGSYSSVAWGASVGNCANCHGSLDGTYDLTGGMVGVVAAHKEADWTNNLGGDNLRNFGDNHRGTATGVGNREEYCDWCHNNTQGLPAYDPAKVANATAQGNHLDGIVQINLETGYQGTTATSEAAAGCATACHPAITPYQMAESNLPLDKTEAGQLFACGACHNNGTVPPTSGAHAIHLTAARGGVWSDTGDYSACEACHGTNGGAGFTIVNGGSADADTHGNGSTTFSAAVTYANPDTIPANADDSCLTTNCHSPNNSVALPGTSPNPASWVDATAATIGCDECHYWAATPSSAANADDFNAVGGSHGAHFAGSWACTECHPDNAADLGGTGVRRTHINDSTGANDGAVLIGRAVAVQDEAEVSAAALGTLAAVDPGNEICDNIACHSPSGDGHGSNPWGTASVGCEMCHNTATAPDTTVAAAPAGSHGAHVTTMGYACTACHDDNTADEAHLNQTIELSNSSAGAITYNPATALDTYPGGFGTCSAGSCHVGPLVWGGTATNCSECHESTVADVNNFSGNDETASQVLDTEYAAVGHGQAAGANKGCLDCHSMAQPHDPSATLGGANPFRLIDQDGATGGIQFSCSFTGVGCHETGTLGPATGLDISTFTSHSDAAMTAAGHSVLRTWPAWDPDCANCHDAHGDGANLSMIQRELYDKAPFGLPAGPPPAAPTEQTALAFTDAATGADATGNSYANTASPWSSICQECHEAADHVSFRDGVSPVMETNHPGTDASPPGDCSTCHQHASAFKPSGCNGCHGDVVSGQYWPDGAGGSPAYADDSAGSAASHDSHVLAIGQYLYGQDLAQLLAAPATDDRQKAICAFCHFDPGGGGHTTDSGDLRVDVIGDGVSAGTFTAFDVAPQATRADANGAASYSGVAKTCANVDCHYQTPTPTYAAAGWDSGNTGAPDCETCHFYRDGGVFPTVAWTPATPQLPDAHQVHVAGIAPPNDDQSKGYPCSYCHDVAGYTAAHTDGQIDLDVSATPNANADESVVQADLSVKYGTGGNATCSGIYCHGSDFAITQGIDVTPVWNDHTTGTCGDCHDINTESGAFKEPLTQGAHEVHMAQLSGVAYGPSIGSHARYCSTCHGRLDDQGSGDCDMCHSSGFIMPGNAGDAGYAWAASASHVDGNFTVDFTNQDRGWNTVADAFVATGTLTTLGTAHDNGTDICNRCHGTALVNASYGGTEAKLNWTTGTRLDCEQCHTAPNGALSLAVTGGVAAPDKEVFYGTSGHGGVAPAQVCENCHDGGGAHISAANGDQDRIVQTDITTFCHYCHDNAVDDNVAGEGVTEVVATIASTHGNDLTNYTPPNPPAETGFSWECLDCHDAHGTSNLWMVNTTINGTPGVTLTADTQFDTGVGTTDICVVCHTQTEHNGEMATAGGSQHTQNYENTNQCLGCHSHEYDSDILTADGFMPLQCDACHGFPPTTADGYLDNTNAVGAHDAHVNGQGFGCSECHNGNNHNQSGWASYAGTVLPGANVDIAFDLASNPAGSYNGTSNDCSTVECHGGNTVNWNTAGPLGCDACHLVATGDVNDFTYGNGTTAAVQNGGEWAARGHGAAAAYASTNPGANLSGPAGDTEGCAYCHDSAVAHGTGTNPFRLANFELVVGAGNGAEDNGFGWNDTCGVCHSSISPVDGTGYDPDGGAAGYGPVDGLNVDQNHFGAKHTGSPITGGSFCWDCHDPHGDTQAYMVHSGDGSAPGLGVTDVGDGAYGVPTSSRPVSGFDVVTLGYNSDDLANAGNTGLCQTCHASSGGALYYNRGTFTALTSHNGANNTRCTVCHDHVGSFGVGCSNCHGYPPPDSPFSGTTVTWSADKAATPASVGAHPTHETYVGLNCNTACHVDTTHLTDKTSANMGVKAPTAAASTGVYQYSTVDNFDVWSNGGTEGNVNVIDDNCANVNCHDSTYLANALRSAANPTYTRYWNSNFDCYSCHAFDGSNSGLRPGAETDDIIGSGSHTAHTGTYALACTNCHDTTGYTTAHKDGVVDFTADFGATRIAAATGGSYDPDGAANGWGTWGGTPIEDGHAYYCGNIYCHSSGEPRGAEVVAYANTTQWTVAASAACGDCHAVDGVQGTMTTNVHEKHAGALGGQYGYACQTCHNGVVDATPAITSTTLHVNGTNNAAFAASEGTYATTGGSVGAAGGTCSATYCHSQGLDWSAPYTQTANAPVTTPDWDTAEGTAGCGYCHGFPPSYANDTSVTPGAVAQTKKNSHAAHSGYACNYCHNATTTDGANITTAANHANNTWDLAAGGGVTFTPTAGSMIGDSYTATSCATISCHNGNGATWGGSLGCADCHLTTGADVDNYSFNDGTMANIDSDEWTWSGHGKPSGSYDVSLTLAANFSATGVDAEGCEYCHDSSVPHGTAANPFRLSNNNVLGNGTVAGNGFGWNDACLVCHNTGDSGYDPDGGGAGYASRNSSVDVDQNHFQAKHVTTEGGQFCWDCHDPHGDRVSGSGNILMVQRTVKKAGAAGDQYGVPQTTVAVDFTTRTLPGNLATTTGYYVELTQTPAQGICQACHDNEAGFSDEVKYWRNDRTEDANGDGTNVTPGAGAHHNAATACVTCHEHSRDFGAQCDTCHGYPPPQAPFAGTTQIWTSDDSGTPATVGAHTSHVLAGAPYVSADCNAACHVATNHPSDKTTANMGLRAATAAASTGVHQYSTVENVDVWADGGTAGITSVVDDSCSNVNCHNSDYPVGSPNQFFSAANPTYTRYWNSNLDCYACHAYDGLSDSPLRPGVQTSVGADKMNSGSHGRHLLGTGASAMNPAYACTDCHADNGVNNAHKDGGIDLPFTTLTDPYTVTETATASGQIPTDNNTGAGHRAYGTCTNIYCHSTVQGATAGSTPTYAAVTWGTDVACGDCHEGLHLSLASASVTTGSHPGHGYTCSTCHTTSGGCTSCHGGGKHGDGFIDLPLDASVGSVTLAGTFDTDGNTGTDEAAVAPGPGHSQYGQCANLYCHSDARTVKAGTATTTTYATIRWGVANPGCEGCHGVAGANVSGTYQYGAPDYANGGTAGQDANSHGAHTSSGIPCAACHVATTADTDPIGGWTFAASAPHADGVIDVAVAAAHDTNGGTAQDNYTAATKTCSGISCHGGGSPTWGGASLSCQDCHLGTGDTDNFVYNDGTTAVVDTTQWGYSGHGKNTGTYDISANPAGNFTGTSPDTEGCLYCHDPAVGHGTATNPFRLRHNNVLGNGTAAGNAYGWNDACLVCHSSQDADGYAPAGYAAKNGPDTDENHYGSKHAVNDGGQFCWDCHDPHGDRVSGSGNIYMVQSAVADATGNQYGIPATTVPLTFIAATTGTDYAQDASPTGICNVCHSATGHYTATTGDGHQSGAVCTSCHLHDSDFAPSACDGCHGDGAGSNWPDSNPADSYEDRGGAHAKHVAAIGTGNASCAACHPGNPPTGHYADTTSGANQAEVIRMDTTGDGYSGPPSVGDYWSFDGSATATGGTAVYFKTLAGADDTGAYYKISGGFRTCVNVNCHGNNETPDWYGNPLPDTTPPSPAPVISVVNPDSDGDLDISWTASTDVDSPPVVYDLFRNTSGGNACIGGTNWTTVGTALGSLGYVDSGLTNGTPYYYCVRAKDSESPTPNSVDSNTATGTPTSPGGGAPSDRQYYFVRPTSTTTLWSGGNTTISTVCGTTENSNYTTSLPPPERGLLSTAGTNCGSASDNNYTQDSSNNTGWVYGAGFYTGTTYSQNTDVAGHATNQGRIAVRANATSDTLRVYLAAVDAAGSHTLSTNYWQGTNLNTGFTPVAMNIDLSGVSVTVPSGSRLAVIFYWNEGSTSTTRYRIFFDNVSVGPFYVWVSESSGPPPDTNAPTFSPDSGIAGVDAGTGGAVNVTWNVATDAEGSTPLRYTLYWSTDTTPFTAPTGTMTNITGTASSVSGLTNGTPYYFGVRATDTSDNTSTNSDASASVTPTASGGGGNTCAICHGVPSDTGAHLAHATADTDYTDCDRCHGDATYAPSTGYTTAGPLSVHNDGNVDMYFLRITGETNAAWNGTACTTADCHFNATTPNWVGGSTNCGSCHQYPPTTQAGAVDHAANLTVAPATLSNLLAKHGGCEKCHGATSSDGTVNGTFTAHANYTAGSHADGFIRMNGPTGVGSEYIDTNGGCDNACHLNNATYQMATSTTRGVNYGDFGAGDCTACHEGSDASAPQVVWPGKDRPTYTDYGAHLLGTTTDNLDALSTDAEWTAQCKKCHGFHSGDAPVIANNAAVGINYPGHGGIFIGGTATTATTEAEVCWECHAAEGISEWGTNAGTGSAYDYGSLTNGANWIGGNWRSARHAANPAFAYKEGTIASTHAATTSTGAGTTTRKGVDDVATIRCSYCHDVHDTKGGSPDGPPFLRGQWRGNPYKEDGAPQNGQSYTNYTYADADSGATAQWGLVPRASNNAAQNYGGYWIDQNSGSPAGSWTPESFGGLCEMCHGDNNGTFSAAEIGVLNEYDAQGVGWVSGANGHLNAVKGAAGSTAAARNIFDGRAGTTTPSYNPYMNYDGMVEPNDSGSKPEVFRGPRSSGRNVPYMTGPSGDTDRPWGYGRNGWGTEERGATTQSLYHNFPCSKCHTPHASRLPALMITNCLDTKQNSWDNGYDLIPTNWGGNSAGKSISQWTSAQNCHRLKGNDSYGTPSVYGDGWNTVTPW